VGLGREVGDAYISVHGDLSDFRKDLDRAGGYAAEQAAMANADKFSEAWDKRITEDVNDRWGKIVDAMYSDKALDWNKLVGTFDPAGNLDEAERKISAFTEDMAKQGKLTTDQQEGFNRALSSTLDTMRERQRLDAENLAAQEKMNAAQSEAITENERWARTFDGIRSNDAIAKTESDFRKLSTAMNDADVGRFVNGFAGFDEARARVVAVTDAMIEQGRMSRDNQLSIIDDIHKHISAEEELQRATAATTAEVERAKLEQERYNKSLDGMMDASKVAAMETQFRKLSDAMASGDWSKITKGAEDMGKLRQSITDSTLEMNRLGRITDQEFLRINTAFAQATKGSEGLAVSLSGSLGRSMGVALGNSDFLQKGLGNLSGTLGAVLAASKGLQEHLGGFVGMNIYGDLIEEGLNFIHNLDGISVAAARTTAQLSIKASAIGDSFAGIVTIVKDLGDSIGQVGLLLPAFATGLGIMAFIGLGALQGVMKQYKNQIQAFREDLAKQINIGLDPAMDRFQNQTLPALRQGMNDTAAAMGRLFGTVLDAVTTSARTNDITLMFKRMNDAMDKSHAGVTALVDAWIVLGRTGTAYFDRFATGFNTMSVKFDDFISKSAANGNLTKWIDAGIQGFKDMGRAIDGTLGIFNAIDDAARAAGSGGLAVFADRLQGAAAIMQSPGFQKSLTEVFAGMADVVSKVGTSIRDLGPAVASITPFIKASLSDVGTAAATLIGYVGKVLQDPAIHLSMLNFTGAMVTAVGKLAPAVAPFTFSLANAMNLLSEVLVNVAEIGSSLVVNITPIFDRMSLKLQTLVDPLKNSALNIINTLTPVVATLSDVFVIPLIGAVRDKLLPAFDDFVKQFGPFADKVIRDLAPVFFTLFDSVLPNLIRLCGELLGPLGKVVDLLSPILVTTMTNLGTALSNMADAVKVLKGELPITELSIFKAFEPAKVQSDLEAQRQSVADNMSGRGNTTSWGKIISDLFWGVAPEVFWAEVWSKLGFNDAGAKKWDDSVGKWLEGARSGISDLLDAQGGNIDKMNASVNKWFDDILFKPIRDGWDSAMKSIDDWWKGVKKSFQEWMSGLLNMDTVPKGGGSISGGAGGKGSSIGSKIETAWNMDDMSFMDRFKAAVGKKWDEFWASVGEKLASWGAAITTGWDGFWDGLGTKVSETWNSALLWIQTKAGEIKTGIDTWAAQVKLNWDTFWDGVGAKISETWNFAVLWVQTKAAEIKANIDGFITGVRTNWTSFWDGIGTKVTLTWNFVTGWIAAKVGEIQGSIGGFIGQVGANWNSFWDSVGSKVSQAWEGIKSGVSGGIDQVLQFFRDLPQNIINAIGDIWSRMKGVGNDIASGLQKGISDGWSWVTNAASSLAQSAVDAAKAALDSHSPSMVFHRIGLDTGLGMANGTDASRGIVMAAAAALATSAVDTVTGYFAKSQMYIAGTEAALGLAAGLKDNKSAVIDAFGALLPADTSVAVGASGFGTAAAAAAAPAKATYITVAAGAIPVTTPTKDPALVAAKVLDGLASTISTF